VSPTVSTLVALALALGDIRGEPIQLYELVYWDGFVSVSGDLVLSGEAHAGFVSGSPVQVLIRDIPGRLDEVREVLGQMKANSIRSGATLIHASSTWTGTCA